MKLEFCRRTLPTRRRCGKEMESVSRRSSEISPLFNWLLKPGVSIN